MTRRDNTLLALLLGFVSLPFLPLILRPWLIPGNFGDIYLYHYPMRHLLVSRLQEGQAPLWNPYIFGGVPLAANPQSLLLYPFSQLHYFLPLSWAFSLDAWLHALLAAGGAFLLLRGWRVDRGGAWVLALAYGLSPFLIYCVAQGVPTHLAALAWAPWMWLAALTRHPLPAALTFALQVLSGHPQFALVNAIGLGLFGLLRDTRRAIALIPAAGFGLFLAAAQVLPTLEYLRHSVRAVWESAYTLGYSMRPGYFLTLLWPEAWGNPFKPDFALMPSEFFEMLGLYLGLLPLALAAFGLARARGRTAAAVWAVLLLGVFLALGENNPAYLALHRLFRLDFLRVPARFGLLALWGLWLAAVIGWGRRGTFRPAVRAGLAAFVSLDLGLCAARWLYAHEPERYLAAQPEIAAVLRRGARVATAPDVQSPNKTMLYRVRNATGYEAFYPAPIALYTAKSEGGPAADGSRTYIERWDSPMMAAFGVRHYLTMQKVPCEAPALRKGSAWLYENPKAAPLVSGAESWTERKAEHLAADAKGPVGLIFRQAHYPGWRAWAKGGELSIAVAEGLFPVALVPESESGSSRVHLKFHPGSWRLGVMISLISLLMMLGIAELRFRTWTSSS